MDKFLWLTECVKSGLQSFVLEIFSSDNAPQFGRPFEVDSDQVETLIEDNKCYSTWEIASILKISKWSSENHLGQLGYVNCFDIWIPHQLSERKFLTVFLHVIFYVAAVKIFCF